MKVKFFHENGKAQKIKKKLILALESLLKSGKYTNGHFVKKFENKFQRFVETKYCAAVNSGTSALHLSLIALGIKEGDEVIVPSITFVASAAAITYIGAKPIFVDVNDNDWLINTKKIEKVITKKTKAIMPVHLHGLMCDMKEINIIAKKFKIKIIEDASQAHGSEYYNSKPGFYSDVATFSFYPTKNLGALGEGGAILTNNVNIYKKVVSLRAWAVNKKNFFDIGYNYRMPEIIAASLEKKIKYLKSDIKKRIQISNFYKKTLITNTFAKFSEYKKHSYHIFALRLKNRDRFINELKNFNIETAIHYSYCLPKLKIFFKYKKKNNFFKISSRISKELISLPIYPELKKKEQEYIVSKVNKIFYDSV